MLLTENFLNGGESEMTDKVRIPGNCNFVHLKKL